MGNIAVPGPATPKQLTHESDAGSPDCNRPDCNRRAGQPFAYVEKHAGGPRLVVGGVCVRWWNGAAYDAEAENMAEQINDDLARRIGCNGA